MVIKTSKGFFKVLKNVKEALNIEQFEIAYIEEIFDHYQYVVGDISDSKLRIKGFSEDPKSEVFYKTIPDYILESCNYQTPYFILKRINEEYYELHKADEIDPLIFEYEEKSFLLEKKPFDKESLRLEKSKKNQPHIVIDSAKMNKVSCFELPEDLKEEVIKSKIMETSQKKFNNTKKNIKNNKSNVNRNEAKVFEHVNSKK